MKIVYTLYLGAGLLLAAGLVACGGGGSGGGGGDNVSGGGGSSSSGSSSTSSSFGAVVYGKTALAMDLASMIHDGYMALDTSFKALNTAATNFCSDVSAESDFNTLREAWKAAMSDWQYMQGINFGPVDEASRRFRIAFYPLDQNQMANRISDLIAGTEAIDQNYIAGRSVDLQGLATLEYVLFREDALSLINVPSETARYCDLINAIAENLVAMSAPLEAAWSELGAYTATFTQADQIENSLEDWFGSLVENLTIIEDSKLRSPAVGNIGDIESPHAGHSIDNIRRNFAMLETAYAMGDTKGLVAILRSEDAASVAAELDARLQSLRAILDASTDSLVALSGDESGVEEIERIADAVHQVLEYTAVEVAEAVDVFIGFNGADGD